MDHAGRLVVGEIRELHFRHQLALGGENLFILNRQKDPQLVREGELGTVGFVVVVVDAERSQLGGAGVHLGGDLLEAA